MSKKSIFMMLAVFVVGIATVLFLPKTVQAAEVTEDGEYTLVLTGNWNDEDVFIDGKQVKLIRFNFEPGETTVDIAELTNEIEVFNGETVFAGWTKNSSPDNIVSKLTKDDFNMDGYIYGKTYANGCLLYARFSEQKLTEAEKYYIILDGYAGKINGEDLIFISQKADEFTTVDLSKYTAVRDGYKFCGWGCDGKIVTSIDKSYFTEGCKVKVTALYKSSEAYNEDDEYIRNYTLILDANGGTLDGETSPKYNYVGGKDSSTSMLIFHYIPERDGYKFLGWNSKKDGSGKACTSIYWRDWTGDSETEFDRDTLVEDWSYYYKNLTLYAVWERIPTSDDMVKEIEAVDGIKGSITFENEVDAEYKLEIKKIDIPDNLLDDIKYLVDINVLSGQDIVEISGIKMTIRLELPEELKDYDSYEIVYVSDKRIAERIPATVKDGYIYFETSHLSQYGIVAKNNSQETSGANEEIVTTPSSSEDNTGNPDAGDSTAMYLILGLVALLGVGTVTFWKKFRVQ